MNDNLLRYFDENLIFRLRNKLMTQKLQQKTVLFIEPYGAVLSLLKRGVEKKFNIIILTANSDLRIVPQEIIDHAMLAIEIDTANHKDVLDFIKILRCMVKINAVIPGFEYFVPIAAQMSSYLNLPSLDLKNVFNLRRKDLMRSTLSQANLKIPNYFLLKSLDQIDLALDHISFPAVCKPIDAAGSVNVKRVFNKNELIQAVERIRNGNDILWGHKLSHTVLVEEYIDGKEYSLEGVVNHGKISHFSLTEKFVADQNEFIEIGHIVNAPIDITLKNKLQDYVEAVIQALGANHCPFHAEVRVTSNGETVLMEIAARLAGDKIGDLIQLSTGVNYFDHVYAAYLGEPLSYTESNSSPAGVRFFYRPEIDQFSSISGLNTIKQFPIENIAIYYETNTPIPSFPKPLRRLGHVIAKNHNYDQLLHTLNEADKIIHFESGNSND